MDKELRRITLKITKFNQCSTYILNRNKHVFQIQLYGKVFIHYCWCARNCKTINLDVGVLLLSATESIGTNTLVSGKYVAVQPTGILNGIMIKFRATRSRPP